QRSRKSLGAPPRTRSSPTNCCVIWRSPRRGLRPARAPDPRIQSNHVRAAPITVAAMEHRNRLASEASAYLLQHAGNPVDWYPWGDEALGLARRLQKPILLSIGYSSCHWCHVMERESFENEDIAREMNDRFVCIKVDREERPDLDDVYMAAT